MLVHKHYLYLLAGLLALLGGCSRCNRDEPQPTPLKQGVFLVDGGYMPDELKPSYPNWPAYDTTGIMYAAGARFYGIWPVDTSYDGYRYHFTNGQVIRGRKRLRLYYDLVYLTDTVYLDCWRTGSLDTVRVKREYRIRPISDWPHLGTYRGTLNFYGSIKENVDVTLYCGIDSVYGNVPILKSRGILQNGCGADFDFYFRNWGSYGADKGIVPDQAYLMPTALQNPDGPCRINGGLIYSRLNQLYTFPTPDSLHFFMIGFDGPAPAAHNDLIKNVTFKGKKI